MSIELVATILCIIVLVYIFKPKTSPKTDKKEFDFLEDRGDWLIYDIPIKRPKGYKLLERDVGLKGISNYIDTFKKMLLSKRFEIVFKTEEDNKYDKNAIVAVWGGKTIGYLPKDISQKIAQNDLQKDLFFVPIAIGINKGQTTGFLRFDIYKRK